MKDEDRRMAKRLLIVGLVITGLFMVGWIALPLIAYTYISGVFTVTSVILEISESTCVGNSIDVTLRNGGTSTSGPLTVTATNVAGDTVKDTCTIEPLKPGANGNCGTNAITRTSADSAGTYGIRARAPGASSAIGAVFCATAGT